MVARKGGPGRNPAGPIRGKLSTFSTRIRAETRAALDAEARATGQSVSQVAELLLRQALAAKRDRERPDPLRALCYLISELPGIICNFKDANGKPAFDWRSNPFMFETLKLSIAKLMETMKPDGEIRSPIETEAGLANSSIWGPHDTPQARADWAVMILWNYLMVAKPVKAAELFGPDLSKQMAADIEHTSYGMADAREHLKIGTSGGQS